MKVRPMHLFERRAGKRDAKMGGQAQQDGAPPSPAADVPYHSACLSSIDRAFGLDH